jgi:hypothetical protein
MNDFLKKVRVNDDQNVYNVGFNNNYGGASPNRTSQSKNYDNGRGQSPSKISPNKTTGGSTKQVMESSHSNNGQVMTQISAIYAKRSRSYLNQFNQTNNQANNNNYNHASQQPNNQNRHSMVNQNHLHANDHYQQEHNKQGSPRLGRLRGISPQSREKNYASNQN